MKYMKIFRDMRKPFKAKRSLNLTFVSFQTIQQKLYDAAGKCRQDTCVALVAQENMPNIYGFK